MVVYLTFFLDRRQVSIDFRERVNFKPMVRFVKKFEVYGILRTSSRIELFKEILGNILLFVPLAAALYFLWPRRLTNIACALLIFGFTLAIETAQYVFNIGVFDVDDIVLNLIGGLLGLALFNVLNKKIN